MTDLTTSEILISWQNDSKRRRLMAIWISALVIFGVILASIIAPTVMSYLIFAGIAYSSAFLIVALAAIALIISLARLFSFNFFLSDFRRIWQKENRNKWDNWYLVANVLGLALGIAVCMYVGPVITSSLMLIGASHGLAMFVTILAGVTLLKLASDVWALPNLIKVSVDKARELWNNEARVARFVLVARAAGVVVGIYLATVVFPLITSALITTAVVPHSIAVITALLLSVGLIGACHSLFSLAAWGVSEIFSLGVTLKTPTYTKLSSIDPQASAHRVEANSLLGVALTKEAPGEYEDCASAYAAIIGPSAVQSL